MQEILASATESLSAEQENEFDALDTEAEKYLRQAEKLEKMESREIQEEAETAQELSSQKTNKSIKDLNQEQLAKLEDIAMRTYLKTGVVPMELRSVMAPAAAEKDDNSMIQSALKEMGLESFATQTTTTTGGGYTIARGFRAELEKAVKAFGGMYEAARIITTGSGNVMDWPTTNDTNNKAYLLAESTSAATSAQAVVFGQQQFEAYKYTSGLIQVPTELLEDSEFNISSLMIELLSERIWRGTNEAFTIADGSSKPKGVVPASTYGLSSKDDASPSPDDFIDLMHAVDPGYRRNARWMFDDTTLKHVKKLSVSSSDIRPLWLPSFRDGEPATILGKPYTINQDVPTWASGNKAVLFGDFSKYIIRQVRNMRIVRLNERYGELDQTAFVVFFRVDGDLLNAGTHPIKHLRVSTT